MSDLAAVLVADDRVPSNEWRARLRLTVAGLPLLVRQLRCLQAGGVGRVLLAGAAWQDIEVPAVNGLRVVRVSGRCSCGDGTAGRRLVLAADTVLDVRLVREFTRAAAGRPEPVVAVDAFERIPPAAAKSPHTVGLPGPDDLREAGDDEPLEPIGLSVTGNPNARPTRVAVGRYGWGRVTCRADARAVSWLVLLSTLKADDGVYGRWNRRFSLHLSRLLVATPLTANMATTLNALFSTAGALLMARGTWGSSLAGSLVLLFTCIFDGVDGEIARARFETSALGEHLDAVEGAVFYVALLAGLGAAVHAAQAWPRVPALTMGAILSAVSWALTSFVVSRDAVRRRTNAERLYRAKMFEDSAGPVRALLRSCSFAFKRAAAGWYLALAAAAGVLPWLFVPVVAGALLAGPIGIYIALLIVRDTRVRTCS